MIDKKADDLASDHWGYIKGLLLTHGCPLEEVDRIGFHYVTAFLHGFKHGREEQ